MSGRIHLDMSAEWRARYFGDDVADVEARIPTGYILGCRALAPRRWRVWLMTDEMPTHRREIVWQVDRIANTTGAEACVFALNKHAVAA